MAPLKEILRVSVEEEMKKNPDMKYEDIQELRTWVSTERHLPPISDEMLVLFHHSCYFNLARTKDCIESYYTARTHAPEFFSNRDVTEPVLARALSGLNYVELPKPDPNGYRIVYHGLREFDPSKYYMVDGMKLLFMTFDSCFLRHGTMPGFIILFDMQGAKLGHLTRLSLSALRKFFFYIQEANPVRLKAIHVINVVSWIDKLMTLIKPFMKKEFLSLLHFHTDTERFCKDVIPRECLPRDYGGELDSVKELNEAQYRTFENLRHFFEEEEKFRLDETKREKKKKIKNGKQSEPNISFEKLEID